MCLIPVSTLDGVYLSAYRRAYFDENARFSIGVFKNVPWVIHQDSHSGRGRPPPPPALTPSPTKRPGVGTQNFGPLNFSAVVAPLIYIIIDFHECLLFFFIRLFHLPLQENHILH